MVRSRMVILFSTVALVTGVGCEHSPELAPPEPPALPVSHPVSRQVTDYVDFTGRTDAVQAVDVRARVSGYLVQMPFKEGAEVKTGDLLFEIDPRPYQAQLDQALSQIELNQASLQLAQTTLVRDQQVDKEAPGGVSKELLDKDAAAVAEAKARVKAFQASSEVYKLNVGYCKVTSPIDGRISRYFLTLGNLVNQDQTLLTTVVSVDPMYAYFDMDEPTLLKIRRAINEGRVKRMQSGEMPVQMSLQGEQGFPHPGKVDFVNNQVNPTTGSISVRGVFPNPMPPNGDRLLSPGMFVRIRLPIGEPHPALLVIDRAIATDQGLKYVYVLDAQNKAEYRRITTGPLQPDGLRVVDGLQPNDWVIIGGQQQVRPKLEIRPDQVAMPTIGPEATDQKSEVGGQKSDVKGQKSDAKAQK
jgi:multidrug efflux system membrane fusion protein